MRSNLAPVPHAHPSSLTACERIAITDRPDTFTDRPQDLPDDPPETIGRKLLRVNLSDLAAMGAAPLGYLMTTVLQRGTPDAWIAGFARGLAEDQRDFGLAHGEIGKVLPDVMSGAMAPKQALDIAAAAYSKAAAEKGFIK